MIEPDAMGRKIDDWAEIPAEQAAAMARSTASVYPVNSKEWQDWTNLADRYTRRATQARVEAREMHGFAGDDS